MKGYHSLTPILCPVLQPFSFLSHVKQPHNSTGEPGGALQKSPREERVSPVMQNKTRKQAAYKPQQSAPYLCWQLGHSRALMIPAAWEHFCSGEVWQAMGAAGW